MGGFNPAWFVAFAVAFLLVAADMLMADKARRIFGRLCIILSIIGFLIGLLGIVHEVYERWGKPGTGIVAAAIGFTLLLWAGLILAIARYRRDSTLAQSLRDEIRNLKVTVSRYQSAQSELHITSATWGAIHLRRDVKEIINSKPRNAVMFYLNNDYFGIEDPAQGDDHKYVKIEYSFGGREIRTVERKQRDWVILPEDPLLRDQLTEAKHKADQAQREAYDVRQANQNLQDGLNEIQKKVQEQSEVYRTEIARHNDTKREMQTQIDSLRQDAAECARQLQDALAHGPEVWLGFQQSTFTVENRSKDSDAISISLDAFETANYLAEPSTLPLLRFDDKAQFLHAAMFHKPGDLRFVDVDLSEMLKDSSDTFECRLVFTLRYADHWGNRFVRNASVEVSKILLNMGRLPEIVNGEIRRDRDSTEDLSRHR